MIIASRFNLGVFRRLPRAEASVATALSLLLKTTVVVGAMGPCVGCQSLSVAREETESRGSHDTPIPAAVEPHSPGHLTVYRNVLSKSRAAPLRAEAANELGEHLADDDESVWALSVATNHENLVVKQAARKALVRIFDARQQGMKDEEDQLEEFEKVAQKKAYQLGEGAIQVIKWLWDNVYFWPEFNAAALPFIIPLGFARRLSRLNRTSPQYAA